MPGDEVAIAEDQREVEEQEQVPFVPDQGEDESDSSDEPSTFSASIASADWTVETLVSQLRKDRIDLSPSFQRRNAWLSNRKSKLIESICLGFPIPQIVLAEQRDTPGRYFVLDGKQRLLALRQFFFDADEPRDEGFEPLRLTSLEVLTELNRLDAAGIQRDHPGTAARLENHTIRTVVLSNWNSERMLLSLFLRLNTGSVPLSPQELRQALIPGPFLHWLDEASGELPSLRRLLGNAHPDRRMADAELMLRHLAFATSPDRYRGNLKAFLDGACRNYNSDWDRLMPAAERASEGFSAALTAAQEAFGTGACRKWSGEKYERALNRAVFDVQIYSLSHEAVRVALVGNEDAVAQAYRTLCDENQAFVRSITSTTKTAEAFITRHREWQRIVEECCGVRYPLPEPLKRD